jgi:hypothetical protein
VQSAILARFQQRNNELEHNLLAAVSEHKPAGEPCPSISNNRNSEHLMFKPVPEIPGKIIMNRTEQLNG